MDTKSSFENCKISGLVVHGKKRGGTVGMPTANLDFDVESIGIEEGVYASIVTYNHKRYIAVTNVGKRPTVDDDLKSTVETNILDFNQDIYGEKIDIELVKKIRDVIKFNSLSEVKEQVDKDKIKASEICKNII